MSMKTKLLLCFLLLFSIATVSAQNTIDNRKSLEKKITVQKSPVVKNVERLMTMRLFDRAIDLAEMYLEKEPGNLSLKSLLAACYEETKAYDKLALFLSNRRDTEPPTFFILSQSGRAFLLTEQPDSAQEMFYGAAVMALEHESWLRQITDQYYSFGMYDESEAFIDSMRILSANPNLLASRKGDILRAQKQYGQAAIEYLNYMERDSLAAFDGERMLISMIRYQESVDTVMAILAKRIQDQMSSRQLAATYGKLLLEQSQYDEARKFYQELDSLRQNRGSDVLYFIRECNKSKEYAQTLLAGQYMLDHYPSSPWLGTIQFAMADAHTGQGNFDAAFSLLNRVAGTFTRESHKSETYLQIGLLFKNHYRDLEKAEEYFNKIVAHSPRTRASLNAKFQLADIYVHRRAFDSAAVVYQFLEEQDLSDDYAEIVHYAQALIKVFQGDFETADAIFRQLITRYPKGFYVNDAIEFALIISEAGSTAPGQMDLFSSAEFFRYTNREDSLEFYLKQICLVNIPSLAPLSYLRLAELDNAKDNSSGAVTAVDSLFAKYPESYFTPYGLKVKADILLKSEQQYDNAIEIYRNLLEQYPKYPFAAEIRDILRRESEANQT